MDKTQLIIKAYLVVCHILKDDGVFPNNADFPLIVYKGAMHLRPLDDISLIKEIFKTNNWTNSWDNGIFNYHHYHSLAHEVLGVFSGKAEIQLGGPHGVCVEIVRGDVLIIPAGVAHKCLRSNDDFKVVGAYPEGMEYDINYGKEGERPQADENIRRVPLPKTDPVYGEQGPLIANWICDSI